MEGPIKLPEDMEVVGFDTGVTHSVGGAEYRAARIGAFMGLKICKGVDAEGKHLADCRPKDLPQPWPDSLPEVTRSLCCVETGPPACVPDQPGVM